MSCKYYTLLIFSVLSMTVFSGDISFTMDRNGLPLLKSGGYQAAKIKLLFWGAKWSWATPYMRKDSNADIWRGKSQKLKMQAVMTPVKVNASPLQWRYDFNVAAATPDAIGGGVEFSLNQKSGLGNAKLLPGNKGWTAGGMKVSFAPALARVYFERGNKNIIRCMFYDKSVTAGKKSFTMSIELPGGGKRVRSLAERYGKADKSKWFKNALHPTKSFVDLSFLNHKPAGKFGMVKAQGDKFVLPNGKEIKFWGANIQAYTLFIKDKALIKAHAKRMAQLGFNLARLHHQDSQRWVKKCLIKKGPSTRELDQEALDSYFYWIKCLKDEGIYLWIDLHVGRPFRPGDEIPGYDEINKKKASYGAEFKGFSYVNKRVMELMQEHNKKLLSTVNPYTGKALKDDTAVMGVLLTNENELTHHFGNALLRDKKVPYHNALFEKKAAGFAQKHSLNKHSLLKTWQPGDSKLLLNDIEYKWNKAMIAHLKTIGIKAPVATCHMWGRSPLFSLPALTAGNVIDAHGYDNGEFLGRDPRKRTDLTQYFASSRVAGMPFTITEWNIEDNAHPEDPFTTPLYMGAMSAFQQWNAPMLYGYSQDKLQGWGVSAWASHNHPAIIGLMPAAALLYRRGDVSKAKEMWVAKLDKNTLINQNSGPHHNRALRELPLMHGLAIALPAIKELPWLKASEIPAGAKVFSDLNKEMLPVGQDYITSDTGELTRDWKKGLFIVNTPKSQGAVGWFKENGRINLQDYSFTSSNSKAALILSSLDNQPIKSSKKILISAVGRVAQIKDKWKKIGMSEPVSAQIGINHSAGNLSLIPLKGDGVKQTAIILRKRNGCYRFSLPTNLNTHHFLLESK